VSYDLYLLRKAEVGDDPAAAYEQLEERGEREPTPAEEQLRRLAADLQAARPGLDLTESDNGFFQLGYESGRPVVIDISAGEITMSWSYGTDIAAAALEEVRKYLPVFERHGYVAYDPQLERVFEPRPRRRRRGRAPPRHPRTAGSGVRRPFRRAAVVEAVAQYRLSAILLTVSLPSSHRTITA
jgi:hypothetical protein